MFGISSALEIRINWPISLNFLQEMGKLQDFFKILGNFYQDLVCMAVAILKFKELVKKFKEITPKTRSKLDMIEFPPGTIG